MREGARGDRQRGERGEGAAFLGWAAAAQRVKEKQNRDELLPGVRRTRIEARITPSPACDDDATP